MTKEQVKADYDLSVDTLSKDSLIELFTEV